MFDVTNFLMRWLFLSNLVRDIAEIQILPYTPSAPQSPPPLTPVGHDPHHARSDLSPVPSLSTGTSVSCEDEWRDQCLRGILSYPPGSQRLLIVDAMRAELVERLSWSLAEADQTLDSHEMARRRKEGRSENNKGRDGPEEGFSSQEEDTSSGGEETTTTTTTTTATTTDSPDTDIETNVRIKEECTPPGSAADSTENARGEANEAERDPKTGKDGASGKEDEEDHPEPTAEEVGDAQNTIRVVRDYLPQLVSVVLKSPPAFDPRLVNPVEKLRKLIVRRCVDDANWGVDMCWLLEAEVGRAWKSLFEHRQQTGRRLIIVLPADKAAVLATIGSGKKESFDLLQDAEQATAFGYTIPLEGSLLYHRNSPDKGRDDHSRLFARQKLPSSLSLRRCSHFGDTMHFIDRLTKISLDLRNVPPVHRNAYLQDSLRELNRRVRRRMITRGDVSLDVEDHRGPDDWPAIADVTSDMLMYSVHLPLDPMQNKVWPGTAATPSDQTTEGAVRILNIVWEEARVLSSRERCPYLVRVEVADTNLRGNDSRLYASGAPGLGATMEEALAMAEGASGGGRGDPGFEHYEIPSELLAPGKPRGTKKPSAVTIRTKDLLVDVPPKEMPRGGWQADETVFYSHSPEDVYPTNSYDSVREDELEQLHYQMHNDPMYNEYGVGAQSLPPPAHQSPSLSTRGALLDRIFGQPLTDKCEEIRQASPYGKVEGWRLASFIMKAGEDIRREALVMQIIAKLNDWFKTDIPEPYRPYMRPYTIMCVGGDAGIVECLADAKSIDEVKKGTDGFQSLRDYFERAYGPPGTYGGAHQQQQQPGTTTETLSFEEAQDNFLRSLVGYSVICYILQIKDRHNANILMDRSGNIIHIDFGFVLGDTPKMCKVPIFSEKAPFKLSDEYWDVLGGWNTNQGGLGVRFCHMFEHAFACASAHSEEIAALVEATMLTMTQNSRQARALANGVRKRLKMRGPPGSNEQKAFVMELVNAARTSMGTTTYDWLQRNMNGYQ